ncbi:MAG: RidA family protein [Deltaproteobacteria bacterium]|nr:RidA family protein [Deltaproteobacteria bacterium]MBW2393361.1 RidA family protein [Deltaproteobacteria bacterium]
MTKREIRTEAAPAPVGPYSQAVIDGNIVYASGQVPLDPATGKLVEGGIEAQAEQAFRNLRAVLEAAGSSMDDVLRAGIYLTDLSDFPTVNEIYARQFGAGAKPARSTLGVAALPLGARIEIDAIASVTSKA